MHEAGVRSCALAANVDRMEWDVCGDMEYAENELELYDNCACNPATRPLAAAITAPKACSAQ